MDNRDDFAIGYIPNQTDDGEPKSMDNFQNNMCTLLLLALFNTLCGTHPEEPKNEE